MHPFPLSIAIGLTLSLSGICQDDDVGQHLELLTDKENNQIEARILSISPDRRILRIERDDGRMFEIEIVKLSLDSQQAVKNWLTGLSGVAESLKLEMAAQRSDGESSREKLDGPRRATWERERMGYRISITNRAAEPAGNLALEYCLLMMENVSVVSKEELTEESPVRWKIRNSGEVRYHRGAIELPLLRFNDEELVDTATIPFDSVRISGGLRESGEDEPIGLIARVVDSQGRTVCEFSDLVRNFGNLTWERLESRLDPREAEGSGMLVEKMALR